MFHSCGSFLLAYKSGMPRNAPSRLTSLRPITSRTRWHDTNRLSGCGRSWFVDRKCEADSLPQPLLACSSAGQTAGWQLVIPLRYVDLNYAFQDRRGAKMQWRSILVGLVVLRLSLSCMLWLAFGLGPSWGFNFHLGFNLHKLDLLFREEKETEPRDNSWSERIHGPRYEETETTCASAGEESPKRSYLSFFDGNKDEYVRRYSSFPDTLKAKMKDMAKEMFYFGYDNYMKYAFPEDELNPIDCEGRGPDVQNPWVIHCYPDYLNWLDLLLWNAVHASRRSVILTVFCTLQFACSCNQTGL